MILILSVLLAQVEFRSPAVPGDPRSQRPWVISAEAGWNGLSGIGAVVGRHLSPHLTMEAGLGLSGEGPKLGIRGRYNFLAQEGTPFLGAGFLYGTGTHGRDGAYTYTVTPSPFLQFTGGLEYQSRAGFNCLMALGYARLLRENFSDNGRGTFGTFGQRFLSDGGLVASISLGYAF